MELFKQWTPILGGAGLIVAFIIYAALKRLPDGNDVMKDIASQIHAGARCDEGYRFADSRWSDGILEA